jgi:GMP synthase-like glutamine amidotransferase
MHRDVLPRYPPAVEKLGYSDRCNVQGIYIKNRVLTVQGHPEYSADIARGFLERRRGSLLDDATYEDGRNRVDNPHDGLTVAAAFLRFLLEE